MICNMCHKDKPNVEQQPSRSQLIFGGYRAFTEARCRDCEKKLCKNVNKMINRISKREMG